MGQHTSAWFANGSAHFSTFCKWVSTPQDSLKMGQHTSEQFANGSAHFSSLQMGQHTSGWFANRSAHFSTFCKWVCTPACFAANGFSTVCDGSAHFSTVCKWISTLQHSLQMGQHTSGWFAMVMQTKLNCTAVLYMLHACTKHYYCLI